MPLELVVFDCDGVILESVDAKIKAFARIGSEFGAEAADRLVIYHRTNLGVSRSEKFAWLYQEYMNREILPEENQALCTRFASFCLGEVLASKLVPGIEDVLKTWKGRIPMYVASGTPQDELHEILAQRGLDKYFDGICGYPPGKKEILSTIIKKACASPEATLMVGDGSADMKAAEAVGTMFYGRGETFNGSGHPWHEDMSELGAYMEKLMQEQ